MRILVIRRDNIGDLVCTTPLIAGLRARYPKAHIAALVNSYNAAVLEGNPDLDAVHVYTKLKHRLPGQSVFGILRARFRMLAELRRKPFDYIVIASASFNRHGLRFARQLRRRHVVGFANGDERGARHVTLKVPAKPYAELHEVQVLSLLAKAIGVDDAEGPLRVFPSKARADAWQKRLGLDALVRPWVAVHISARKAACQWPAKSWIELIAQLTSSGTGVVLVWAPGSENNPRHPGDDEKAVRVLAGVRASPLVRSAPTADLEDLIAVLTLCQAFVGSDGGAMHIAAALGLPVVAIFDSVASTRDRWHPWGVPYEIVHSRRSDIADTSVAEVVEAWQRLARGRTRPGTLARL